MPDMNTLEIVLAAGTGIGLASVAGIRAFVPLLLAALAARLGLLELPDALSFLSEWAFVGVLVGLAVAEAVLDKFGALDRVLDGVMTPVRLASGALLFAVALQSTLWAGAIPELVAGGVIAAAVSVLKAVLRPPVGSGNVGVSDGFISIMEDAVALVGGVVAILVPLVPLAFVAFFLFFLYRVRRRRAKKYGGLRILGD
ncbi:DUF4126 domain-containing protein [Rubrobacter aplysinae]|uniref:DUF4126 domain-containing protein n=1 Tax=Rubrobacter aplysinae TaxID=909625 RepID=UPI00064BCBD6|nr:DUF4126 domain-containing protein [Rubrobacter aplysinae]